MRDLYAVLGVSRDATREQIKRAYRRLSTRLHPDVGGNPEAFGEANVAYSVLCDEAARAHYDETGEFDAGSVLNDDTQVFACITDALAKVLSCDDDMLGSDLVAVVIEIIRTDLKPLEKSLNVAERVMARVGRSDGRFKPKQPGGDDIVARSLDWHRRNATNAQRKCRREIDVKQRAIEVLKGYSFDPETGGMAPPMGGLNPFGGLRPIWTY